MPKYDQSRLAIILSGIGATLLMLALYFVFSMILYALVAAAILACIGLVLTTLYKYENFWPESDPADAALDRKTLSVCRFLLLAGIIIGLLLRLANLNGPMALTAFVAGALLLVFGMLLTIRLRLRRYNRRLI